MNNVKTNKKNKEIKNVNSIKELEAHKKAGLTIIFIAVIILIIALCSFSVLFSGIDYGSGNTSISGESKYATVKVPSEKAKEVFDLNYFSDLTLISQTIARGTNWLELCPNTEKEIDGEIYIKSCDKLYSSVEDVKKSFSDIATTKYIDSLMGKDYIDYDGSLYVKSYSNNIDEKYIEMASYKVVESTSDKISYLVKSRYGDLGCSTSCKYEYKEHKFTLVNENNKWKVSEFDMPY